MNNQPAFPFVWHNRLTERDQISLGMTIRDYFAAKAMAAIILREGKGHLVVEEITITAYQYADSMLEVREQ